MELREVFDTRYSVRKFSDKEIDKEILNKVLDAGRIAPTATNAQPQRIYVLQSKESLEKLDSVTPMRYGANTVLMICCDMDIVWKNRREEGYNTADMDCSIVTTYMMLEATNLGLGTLWVRAFNSVDMQKAFDLPENIKPICIMPIGYKADDCTPNENFHFSRNSLEDEVKYL